MSSEQAEPRPSCSHASGQCGGGGGGGGGGSSTAAKSSSSKSEQDLSSAAAGVANAVDEDKNASSNSGSSDSSASVSCAVCGKDITNLKQQVHYGAHACFCCRAFFRRAQNAKRRANWRCELENKCEINEQTRRSCTWCRYQRCLQVGMKESLVLTEAEKKHRFRKLLKKKRKLAKNKDEQAAEDANNQQQQQQQSESSCSLRDEGPKAVGGNMSAIQQMLLDIQTGKVTPSLNYLHIGDLIRLLQQRFHDFTFAQDEFLALLCTDRRHLRSKNSSRFMQCIMCQYFISHDGWEQAKLVLDDTSSVEANYCKVSIEDVDRYTLGKLFGNECILKKTFVSLLQSTCEGLDKIKESIDFAVVHKMILFTHDNDNNGGGSDATSINESGSNMAEPNAEYHLITQFQKDLALLYNILLALYHSHVCLPNFHLKSFDLTRDAFFRLVFERSHFEVRRIVIGHEEQIDGDLRSLISDKIRQIMFLFLVRLDLAKSLGEQFKILNHSETNHQKSNPGGGKGIGSIGDHFVIFGGGRGGGGGAKGAHPVRQKRFQLLLLEWRNCLGDPDLFFLIVLLAVFYKQKSSSTASSFSSSASDNDEGLMQLRKNYLSVLSTTVKPLQEALFDSISTCLDNLEEATDLCPSFP